MRCVVLCNLAVLHSRQGEHEASEWQHATIAHTLAPQLRGEHAELLAHAAWCRATNALAELGADPAAPARGNSQRRRQSRSTRDDDASAAAAADDDGAAASHRQERADRAVALARAALAAAESCARARCVLVADHQELCDGRTVRVTFSSSQIFPKRRLFVFSFLFFRIFFFFSFFFFLFLRRRPLCQVESWERERERDDRHLRPPVLRPGGSAPPLSKPLPRCAPFPPCEFDALRCAPCEWLLRATVGVAALLAKDAAAARLELKAVCAAVDATRSRQLPPWLAPRAVAATAWANHAAAIAADGAHDARDESIALLDASLQRLPTYTQLHRQLANALRLANRFHLAMTALNCSLSVPEAIQQATRRNARDRARGDGDGDHHHPPARDRPKRKPKTTLARKPQTSTPGRAASSKGPATLTSRD